MSNNCQIKNDQVNISNIGLFVKNVGEVEPPVEPDASVEERLRNVF